MTTATATLTLWLLMDPLGNLPVFSSVLKGVAPRRRRRVLLRELGLALGFLVLTLVGRVALRRAMQRQAEYDAASPFFGRRLCFLQSPSSLLLFFLSAPDGLRSHRAVVETRKR